MTAGGRSFAPVPPTTSPLCQSCRRLPSLELFAPEHDSPSSISDRASATIPPFRYLQASASRGCRLCSFITSKADLSCIPEHDLALRPLTLRRSRIGPEQSITGYFNINDECFVTYFSRIPDSWNQLDPSCTTFEQYLHLVKEWTQICQTQHPHCVVDRKFLASIRLIDLEAFDGGKDVRLISSSSIAAKEPNYVALSHCWGDRSQRPIVTTRESYVHRADRIMFGELPTTFQDAVDFCRRLGYRYLWIDSLCIIQDDVEDWNEQAAQMPAIYGGSTLTIAALSSADGRGGCRVKCPATGIAGSYEYIDVRSGRNTIRFFKNKPEYWYAEYGDNPFKHSDFGNNPLRTRAWTLQERELPVRSVHFAESMLLWQCQTMQRTDQLPWTEIKPLDDFRPLLMQDYPDELLGPGTAYCFRDRWYDVVEDYSSRVMTMESDKLTALAGLASDLAVKLQQADRHADVRYLAGLWSLHMPASLLWNCRTYSDGLGGKNRWHTAFWPRRPMIKRAPTWSWASLDGAVSYDSQRLNPAVQNHPNWVSGGGARITGVETVPKAHDLYGAIQSDSGKLFVEGQLVRLSYSFRSAPLQTDTYGIYQFLQLDDDEEVVGVLFPDIVQEMRSVENLFCLNLRREPYAGNSVCPYLTSDALSTEEKFEQSGPLYMGLALVQIQTEGSVFYERRGLLRWFRPKLFTDVVTTDICII